MEKGKSRKLGTAAGAIGLLVLALNLVDFLAGWNAIADFTAIVGLFLALAGAYLVLKG